MGTLPDARFVGPFIKFNNYDPESYLYTASVLIVVHPSAGDEPRLDYEAAEGEATSAEAIQLDEFQGYRFLRFDMSLTLGEAERRVAYTVYVDGDAAQYAFFVPGTNQPWHWAFYSCNGFHEPAEAAELDGIQPLWIDFNNQHRAQPFHVQVGGGDQLYNDPVWKIKTLVDWLAIDKDTRVNEEPSDAMTDETNLYYFSHYCQHFSEAQFRDALASVPYIFSWDDHDIFDGYGSYSPTLQFSPVFNMVFAAAKRFYLLFQQHASEHTIARLNNTWGGQGGFNEIKRFGPSVALWAMDNRTERTRDQIVSKETHDMAKQQLLQLEGVRHVVVLATVPLVFPELPAEGAFEGIQGGQGFWGLFNKTGLGADLMNQFGEPDLLDDIVDHWTAATHVEERKYLIQNMQEVAKEKRVRVTFISGDVHSAGIGRFYSYPKKHGEDFRTDFRFMANITSSAMGNTPMPLGLVTAYNKTNRAGTIPGLEPTREKMVRRFRGGNDKVYGNRNYCTVTEFPFDPASDDINNGAFNFSLRGEDRRQPGKVDHWDNFVPVLTTVEDTWDASTDGVAWAGTASMDGQRGVESDDEAPPAAVQSIDRSFSMPGTSTDRGLLGGSGGGLLGKLGKKLVKKAVKKLVGGSKHGHGGGHGGHGEGHGHAHGGGHHEGGYGSGSSSEHEHERGHGHTVVYGVEHGHVEHRASSASDAKSEAESEASKAESEAESEAESAASEAESEAESAGSD